MSRDARQFFDVPAGTRHAPCRGPSCPSTIYFIKHPFTGKAHPIDCDVAGGCRPSARANDPAQGGLFEDPALVEQAHDGRGISHFENCPDAADFRRQQRQGVVE